MRKILICLMFVICGLFPSMAETHAAVYTTWENMEIDKCASAWLIRRFIDPSASFKFFPKGVLITEGIPFDVPEAEIRRYHNMSAFEYLLKKHGINDPALLRMGKIIHDIEINYWGKKQVEESQKINDTIREIIKNSKSAADILKKSSDFFESWYSDFGEQM